MLVRESQICGIRLKYLPFKGVVIAAADWISFEKIKAVRHNIVPEEDRSGDAIHREKTGNGLNTRRFSLKIQSQP